MYFFAPIGCNVFAWCFSLFLSGPLESCSSARISGRQTIRPPARALTRLPCRPVVFQNIIYEIAPTFRCSLAKIWVYAKQGSCCAVFWKTNDIDFHNDNTVLHGEKKTQTFWWPNVMRKVAPRNSPKEHRCLILLLGAKGNFCNIHHSQTSSSANPVRSGCSKCIALLAPLGTHFLDKITFKELVNCLCFTTIGANILWAQSRACLWQLNYALANWIHLLTLSPVGFSRFIYISIKRCLGKGNFRPKLSPLLFTCLFDRLKV